MSENTRDVDTLLALDGSGQLLDITTGERNALAAAALKSDPGFTAERRAAIAALLKGVRKRAEARAEVEMLSELFEDQYNALVADCDKAPSWEEVLPWFGRIELQILKEIQNPILWKVDLDKKALYLTSGDPVQNGQKGGYDRSKNNERWRYFTQAEYEEFHSRHPIDSGSLYLTGGREYNRNLASVMSDGSVHYRPGQGEWYYSRFLLEVREGEWFGY